MGKYRETFYDLRTAFKKKCHIEKSEIYERNINRRIYYVIFNRDQK